MGGTDLGDLSDEGGTNLRSFDFKLLFEFAEARLASITRGLEYRHLIAVVDAVGRL